MKRTLIALVMLLGISAHATNEKGQDSNQSVDQQKNYNESLFWEINAADPTPFYDYTYGPGRTVRWYNSGTNRVPKILSDSTVLEIGGRLVNEIVIRASENRVNVRSIVAILVDGRRLDLWSLTGTIRENREIRARIDRNYSVRVLRLEIQATSPNLIGSRGRFQVLLGLAD